jgi:drug/metabolite transporter (DMT)-like permease
VLAWFLLIALSIIWGSSFILIKKALISFSALEVGAGRIVFSFLAFLPLFLRHYRDIPLNKMKAFAVVGLCGSGFPAFLYAIGQTHIPSSIAGVINSATPIFTLLFGVLFFSGRIFGKQLAGILIGFGGILLLFFVRKEGELAFPVSYALLCVLATVSYAISGNTVGKYLSDARPVIISVVSFMIIGPFMLVYLLSGDFVYKIYSTETGWLSLSCLLALSLVGTFLANILFFKLIQLTDPVFSSSVSFLIPVVAILWGALDGEMITLYHFASLILILGGIFLVKIKK